MSTKKILFCQKPQTAFCVNLTSNPRLLPSVRSLGAPSDAFRNPFPTTSRRA